MPRRAVEVVRGHEPAPQVLVPNEEQVTVLGHVEREPVFLGEPGDHRHARLREPDVHLAGELITEAAGARPGRTRGQVIRPFEHHDAPRPGGREVIRGARTHDAAPDDHDVRRRAHRRSTAARATIRSSNATPHRLEDRDVGGGRPNLCPADEFGEVGADVLAPDRAFPDGDQGGPRPRRRRPRACRRRPWPGGRRPCRVRASSADRLPPRSRGCRRRVPRPRPRDARSSCTCRSGPRPTRRRVSRSERGARPRPRVRPGRPPASAPRDTTTTSSIGRTARIASRCAEAWTPAPNRTRRLGPSRASSRVATPLTAAVRSAVSAAPSSVATGACVSASNST